MAAEENLSAPEGPLVRAADARFTASVAPAYHPELRHRDDSAGPVVGERTAVPELATVARGVLPVPRPGERYPVRALTELWAQQVGTGSPHTRKAYTHALRAWLDYCWRARLDPLAARRADVDDWLAQLPPDTGADTAHTRLAGIRSWYAYLLDNDVPSTDPATRVKGPARQRGAARTAFLDEDGLNALLATARHRAAATGPGRSGAVGERAARTHAVLAVLATTAVRAAAVQQATIADVSGVQAGHRVLSYTTKGGNQKYKPLVPYAAAAVDTYLTRRAARAGVPLDALDPGARAFVTTPYHGQPGGKPLSSGMLAGMVRDTARTAGLGNAEALVPHSLRHTTATLLARVRPLPEVQDYLDHRDPRTTRAYVHTDQALNNSPAYTAASFIHDT